MKKIEAQTIEKINNLIKAILYVAFSLTVLLFITYGGNSILSGFGYLIAGLLVWHEIVNYGKINGPN